MLFTATGAGRTEIGMPCACFVEMTKSAAVSFAVFFSVKAPIRYSALLLLYRKLNGFTQERLAEALNLDRTTISKIELATSGVSLDVIFEMCDLFSISPSKLFDFRD